MTPEPRSRTLTDVAVDYPFAVAALAVLAGIGLSIGNDILGDPLSGAAVGRAVFAFALVVAAPIAVRRPAYDVVTAYAVDFVAAFLGLGLVFAVPLFAVGGVETRSPAAQLLRWLHLLSSYVLAAVETRYEVLARMLVRW